MANATCGPHCSLGSNIIPRTLIVDFVVMASPFNEISIVKTVFDFIVALTKLWTIYIFKIFCHNHFCFWKPWNSKVLYLTIFGDRDFYVYGGEREREYVCVCVFQVLLKSFVERGNFLLLALNVMSSWYFMSAYIFRGEVNFKKNKIFHRAFYLKVDYLKRGKICLKLILLYNWTGLEKGWFSLLLLFSSSGANPVKIFTP